MVAACFSFYLDQLYGTEGETETHMARCSSGHEHRGHDPLPPLTHTAIPPYGALYSRLLTAYATLVSTPVLS
jgi:hypothetical protein